MQLDNNVIKKRYEWVDVLKFLGIFAIYLGHLGNSAGKFYLFVFTYHVPLFFFISGFFALKNTEESVFNYTKKKFKQLLVPYIFFSVINIIIYAISYDISGGAIISMFKVAAMGIRNTIVAGGGLWFFPCLFIVSVMYYSIYKAFKNKYLVFISVFIIYVISQTLLPYEPSWFMNIDSAMFYIMFYCLGNLTFKYLKNFNFKKMNLVFKALFGLLIITSISITAVIYFKGFSVTLGYFNRTLSMLNFIPIISSFYNLFITLNLIFFNIMLAYLLKDIKLLQEVGANTLTLCGTEGIVKTLIDSVFSLVGINIIITGQLSALIYTFICLVIAYKTVYCFLNEKYPILIGK